MKKVVTIDLETSPLGPFSIDAIDMVNKRCSCGKGRFREMYLHNDWCTEEEFHELMYSDDWNGTLNCKACDKETKRYITRADYREQQINKILQ